MGKISLHKLLLVFCVVVWCWWCWWWSEWRNHPNIYIYIRIELSTTRFNKEFKQVLPYQATSGKTWPTSSIYCTCFFQHVASQNRTRARTNMGKFSLHKLLLVFCVVAWCWWCWWWSEWWSEWWNHPNISIFSLHFSSPEFTKSSNKLYPTN